MSVLVKVSSTRAQAFRRGFWKGLGAPVVLFGTFDLDQASADDFKPKPLPVRHRGNVAEDWKKVGADIVEAAKLG